MSPSIRFLKLFAKPLLALIVVSAAAVSSSPVYAQSTMTVDGSCQFTLSPSTTVAAVQINPTTGNVTVNSTGGGCTPPSVTITVPSQPVTIGQSFNVSWTSTGTTTCTRSGGVAGWPGSGTTGNVTLSSASAAPGTTAFNISCTTAGNPVNDSKNVQFQNPVAASVNLTPSSTSVQVGTSFTLAWTSTGTTGCTPSGGAGTSWASSGSLPTSNAGFPLTAPGSAASNVSFTITCNTGTGTVSDTEFVSFTEPTNCSGVTLPPGISGFAQQTWSTLYGGANFPRIYSNNKTFNVASGQGLRIAITPTIPTNGDTPNGTLTYNEASAIARAGFMTISRCPGDFRINTLNLPAGCNGVQTPCTTKCHTGAEAMGQLSLGFRLSGTTTNSCNMTPGVQYYVNIHFGGTSTPGPDGAFCAGPQCAIIGGTQAFLTEETLALKWLQGDLLGLSPDQGTSLVMKLDSSAAP